jgi:thiol-disulfide isomerase/thioredoxin
MWATWCTSCIERFPKMVSLHNKYADRGVQIVSMNLDDHGDTQAIAAANRFLRSVGARFPNYHMDENLMQAFEKLDLIGIPVVAIYDKQGEQRYRLTGDNPYKQFTDRDIETAIQHLLNE